MLVDDDPARACLVEERLWASGYDVVAVIGSAADLLLRIDRHLPDVILIDLQSPDRDVLESLSIVTRHNPRPVVMFTQQDDPDYINQAVEAGISTYLVGDMDPRLVKPVIDVAIAQFRSFQRLRDELDSTRVQLEDRKFIEQAKGLLMAYRNIGEEEAHRAMTRLAMDANERLPEVARRLVASLSPRTSEGSAGRPPPGGRGRAARGTGETSR
jgi:response regulator NasT